MSKPVDPVSSSEVRLAAPASVGSAPAAAPVPVPVPAQASAPTPSRRGRGLAVPRRNSRDGQTAAEVLDAVEWSRRPAKISGADGEVVFKMDDAEVPADWSQLATDVAVSKYFRKAGLPTKSGAEESVRQLVRRVAHTLRTAGEEQGGHFATPADADAFEAELSYYLVHQIGAFNSPVWFNCGLWHEYKIAGSGGNWAVDLATGAAVETKDAYSRPQVSACFIQSCQDDLDSIFQLIHDEARVFKYGSGSGTNFSKLRGRTERLSGGGTSSGLMSFLEVLDRAAGATKSGGITRRAAKMVVLDADHPEIRDFITWKAREEKKVAALIAGGYPSDFNGEAYRTVSGQNANNSVRISDKLLKLVEQDGVWETRARTTGEVVEKLSARALWHELAEAAWKCADPGIQYDDTINRWHTCKATDRINASNPCSEFVFLDDTACNLASLNLLKFLKDEDGPNGRRPTFDVEGYQHACRVFFLAQEIAVDLASYPTKRIAERSHQYRPLGLGYANLGTLLMVCGLPYDSDAGRAMAAALTAVMTGEAYALSAELAATKGPFADFPKNRDGMLEVMRLHKSAVQAIARDQAPSVILAAAHEAWGRAVALGEQHGYRNAQATVLAPTGTIGLLMDCDTTGVEPDFSLIKFKKLAGGGSFKIVNQSVPRALKRLGYAPAEVQAIVDFVRGTASLKSTVEFAPAELVARGLNEAEIARVEKALNSVFDLRAAFAPHVLGVGCLERLGLAPRAPGAEVLQKLGYRDVQIDAASLTVCGRQTVEGAPFLKAEHYAVFDCANRCGPLGTRYIEPMGHVRMMAAVQPFLSGAISKTINMPAEATVADVERIHTESWRLGLKAIAIYRDGSKLSQPLSSGDKDKAPQGPAPVPGKVPELAATLQKLLQLTAEQATLMAKACLEPEKAQAALQPAPTPLPLAARRRLPAKRHGLTQEAKVGGNKIFLRTGEYEDGSLGEIFIDMHKEGAALRSVMNCFAMLVSIALQYGVPLEVLVEQFVFTRFEPQGPVQGHDRVKFATSVIDYVFRALGVEYLSRDDLAHVTPEAAAATPAANMGLEPGTQAAPYSPATVAKAAQRPGSSPVLPALPAPAAALAASAATKPVRKSHGAQDEMLGKLSGDAPFCDGCGHITVRNGTCYKCLNCGNSMGCS